MSRTREIKTVLWGLYPKINEHLARHRNNMFPHPLSQYPDKLNDLSRIIDQSNAEIHYLAQIKECLEQCATDARNAQAYSIDTECQKIISLINPILITEQTVSGANDIKREPWYIVQHLKDHDIQAWQDSIKRMLTSPKLLIAQHYSRDKAAALNAFNDHSSTQHSRCFIEIMLNPDDWGQMPNFGKHSIKDRYFLKNKSLCLKPAHISHIEIKNPHRSVYTIDDDYTLCQIKNPGNHRPQA